MKYEHINKKNQMHPYFSVCSFWIVLTVDHFLDGFRYGARSLQLSKIVPSICKLLDDQNSQVRSLCISPDISPDKV